MNWIDAEKITPKPLVFESMLGQQVVICPVCSRAMTGKPLPAYPEGLPHETVQTHTEKEHRLKVYGWTGYRSGQQTREVMAAKSVAEVMRATGYSRSEIVNYGSITGNVEEVALALRNPHTSFYRPLQRVEPGGWVKGDR